MFCFHSLLRTPRHTATVEARRQQSIYVNGDNAELKLQIAIIMFCCAVCCIGVEIDTYTQQNAAYKFIYNPVELK